MAKQNFDRQFKMTAVKLVVNEGYSVKEVNKELVAHSNTLYRWMYEYEQYGKKAFPCHGSTPFNAQYEIRKLQKIRLSRRN